MTSKLTKACDIHSQKEAVQWCSLCDQALCMVCVEYHSQAKPSKNHKTIPMTDFMKLPSSVRLMNKICEQHDEQMEYFCCLHESLCCFSCLQSTHKRCDTIESAQKLAENIQDSSYIEDLESNIENVLMNFKKLIGNRNQNISNIDKQKEQTMKQIADHKKHLIAKLDKLEHTFKRDLSDLVKKEKSHNQKFLNGLRKRELKMKQHKEDLKIIKELAAAIDVFLGANEMRKSVQQEVSFLQSIDTDTAQNTTDILLDSNDRLGTFGSHFDVFGKLIVYTKAVKITFTHTNKSQAQILSSPGKIGVQPESDNKDCQVMGEERKDAEIDSTQSDLQEKLVDEIGLTVDSSVTIPGTHMQIVACKKWLSNQTVYLDYFNKKLLVCSDTSVKQIPVTSNPIDFTFIEEHICVVTLYNENAVSLIDISNGLESKRFIVMGKCFGIDHGMNTFYVTLPHMNKIQILENKSLTIKLLTISTMKSAYYVKYFNNMLFCSNHIQNVVFCLSVTGLNLWEFQSNILKEPLCLAVDTAGNLYVTCRKNKTVVSISTDGKCGKTVAKTIPAIQAPRAIDCINSNKLLVCDEQSGLGIMFELKQKV